MKGKTFEELRLFGRDVHRKTLLHRVVEAFVQSTLEKVALPFEESAIAVRAHGLHDADVDEPGEKRGEFLLVHLRVLVDGVQVAVEQLVAQGERQVGLRVEEQRGQVVLQRAFAPALIIQEVGLAGAQHHIAGLEIAIEKIVVTGTQQELG